MDTLFMDTMSMITLSMDTLSMVIVHEQLDKSSWSKHNRFQIEKMCCINLCQWAKLDYGNNAMSAASFIIINVIMTRTKQVL